MNIMAKKQSFPVSIEKLIAAVREPLGREVMDALSDFDVRASELRNPRLDIEWREGESSLDPGSGEYTMRLEWTLSINASGKRRARP